MNLPGAGGTTQQITGRINIDTSPALASLRALTQSAQQELGRLGTTITQSLSRNLGSFRIDQQLRSVREFSDSLSPFHTAVGEARVQLIGITAAATAFVSVGLKAADTVDILTRRYTELGGSVEAGNLLMRRVANAAESLNQPILTTQKNFIGLIPAIREVNGDLENYVNIASRLATLNTDARGGLEGAIYAIREALSSGGTDLVSLSDRFNIPRKTLRALIQETGSLEKALDEVLNRYGATTEAVQAQSRLLSVLGQRLADVGQRLLARVFAGALETARAAIEGLIRALESIPDWLVGVGGAALLAVGGLSALILITDTLTNSYIRVAGAALNFANLLQSKTIPSIVRATTAARAYVAANQLPQSTLGRAGVAVGALGFGAAVGVGAVNLVGRFAESVSGRENRFTDFGFNDALDTLKQILFLLLNSLIDAFKPLATVLTVIVYHFNNLQKILQIFGLSLQILMTDLQITLQEFLIRIGQGSQEELNRLRTIRGERFYEDGIDGQRRLIRSTGLQGQLDELGLQAAVGLGEALQQTDDLFNRIKLGIVDALFPVSGEVEEVSNAFEKLINSIQDNINQLGAEIGDEFAKRADSEIAFQQELADLFENGDKDTIEARLRGLEQERDAIEAILPELERHAEYSNDAAEKLAELRGRLDEITQQLPRFADALEQAVIRGLSKANQEFADAVRKATEDRDKALDDLQKKTNKKSIDLDKQYGKDLVKAKKEQQDIQDKYNDAILKAEDQFRKRLAEIQRNYITAVTLAASLLDAAGVAAAINDRIEQRLKAEEGKSDAEKSANEQREDRRKQLAEEAADKRAAYEEQRKDLIDDFKERRDEIVDQFLEEQAVARMARDTEITEIQTYYAQRLTDLQNYQRLELALRAQQQQEILQRLAKAITDPILTPIGNAVNNAGNWLGDLLSRASQSNNSSNLLSSSSNVNGQYVVTFNISSPHDPQTIANEVNRQLVYLANGSGGGGGSRK